MFFMFLANVLDYHIIALVLVQVVDEQVLVLVLVQ